MNHVQLLVGTVKGLFICRADETRAKWQTEGPLLDDWRIDSVLGDSRHGDRIFVGASHKADGPVIQLSQDGGQSWTQLPDGPSYPATSSRSLRGI